MSEVIEVFNAPPVQVIEILVSPPGPTGPPGPAIDDEVLAGAITTYFTDNPSPDLQEHINSSTPHPVYDDGPSLVLLFENALT